MSKYCMGQRDSIYPFESLLRADIQLFEQYAAKSEKIGIPLTVIVGTQDPVVDLERVKAWSQLAANAYEFYQIEGGRHDLVKANRDDLIGILMDAMELAEPAINV